MNKKRVLVIEDDPDVRDLLGLLLSRLNVDVIIASDGVQGIAAASVERPHLILVDLHLPKMSGMDVIRVIKTMPDFAAVPILVLTGNTTADSIREAVQVGAADFLVKSNFLTGQGLDRVRRFLDSSIVPRAAGPARLPRMKVLVVEDDEELRDSVRGSLEGLDQEVVCAADGLNGIAAAAEERPDVIFLDLHLPPVNGFDVMVTLRNVARLTSTPVILLTHYATPESIREAMQLQAVDYLTRDDFHCAPGLERFRKALTLAASRRPAEAAAPGARRLEESFR